MNEQVNSAPGLVLAARWATADEDIVVADANGGWRLADAMTAARLLEGLPRLYFEQPCPTLEECLSVRRHTSLPFVLDEVITDVETFLRAWRERGMDAINLKISRVGGLTRARRLRELEGARETDRPGADHHDVRRAHAETLKSGSPRASRSTATPSPGDPGASPRPPAERGS